MKASFPVERFQEAGQSAVALITLLHHRSELEELNALFEAILADRELAELLLVRLGAARLADLRRMAAAQAVDVATLIERYGFAVAGEVVAR